MWCLERVHRTGEIELLAYAQTERQAIELFRQVRVGEYGPGLWKAPATCYMRIRGFDISAGDPLREGRRLCTSSS